MTGTVLAGLGAVTLTRWLAHPHLRLLLLVGLLGGYTTYSTFALESLALWERGERAMSLGYMGATVPGGFLAAALGAAAGRALAGPPTEPAAVVRADPAWPATAGRCTVVAEDRWDRPGGREGAEMSVHRATIQWTRESPDFTFESYNRDHDWSFDAGVTIRASATPAYNGNAQCVDPEEAYVASIASCHMLTLLAVAARRRFVVDEYRDEAVGVLEKDSNGRVWITRVTLRPRIRFSGDRVPTAQEIEQLNKQAHHACFIANSVKTEIVVEPADT